MNAVYNKLNKIHKTIGTTLYLYNIFKQQSMVTIMNKECQTMKPGNFYKHKESKMGCFNEVAHILSL